MPLGAPIFRRAVERAANVDQARLGPIPIAGCAKAMQNFVVRATGARLECRGLRRRARHADRRL